MIKDIVIKEFGNYLHAKTPQDMFHAFDRFRILCALREGPYGVVSLNSNIEQILSEEGMIHPDKRWYPGRPVMVTSNDYNLKLFNGDIGIAIPDHTGEADLRVIFRDSDGSLRKFHL